METEHFQYFQELVRACGVTVPLATRPQVWLYRGARLTFRVATVDPGCSRLLARA